MCGIAGIIDLTGRNLAPTGVVRRMADAIIHRGPDEEGYLDEPEMVLANRRLSIVGLADGQQPIWNEDRSVVTVFNGEFFDYPEKRKELEAKGHVFRTHTDTELIPHLWEEYGEGMFAHLKGQFAFCVWSSPRACPNSWPRMNWLLHTFRTSAVKFSCEIALGAPLSWHGVQTSGGALKS